MVYKAGDTDTLKRLLLDVEKENFEYENNNKMSAIKMIEAEICAQIKL